MGKEFLTRRGFERVQRDSLGLEIYSFRWGMSPHHTPISGCQQCHGGTVKVLASGKISPNTFTSKIEWTYFLLWHHEGRRARHGASMMAPGSTDFILAQDQHKWKKGIGKEEREKMKKFYEERYGK